MVEELQEQQQQQQQATLAVVPRPVDELAVALWHGMPEAQVEAAVRIAKAFAPVVEQRRLYVEIDGRRYVTREGWEALGVLARVSAQVVWVRPIEGGYHARAECRRVADGMVLTAAEAICLAEEYEHQRKRRPQYALCSMAQTRAESKALAMALRWILTLAGQTYEATPAEEMEGVVVEGEHREVPSAQAERQERSAWERDRGLREAIRERQPRLRAPQEPQRASAPARQEQRRQQAEARQASASRPAGSVVRGSLPLCPEHPQVDWVRAEYSDQRWFAYCRQCDFRTPLPCTDPVETERVRRSCYVVLEEAGVPRAERHTKLREVITGSAEVSLRDHIPQWLARARNLTMDLYWLEALAKCEALKRTEDTDGGEL